MATCTCALKGHIPGTAGQQAAFLLNYEMKLSECPVMGARGIAGMKQSKNNSGLSGRQAQDANYFLAF